MGIPAPLDSTIRNLDNFDNYTIDLMWLLMRILINRAKELSLRIESDTFSQIWGMTDNSSCFSNDKIHVFHKIAQRLAVFVRQHLLVAFPTIQVDELLPHVDQKERPVEEQLVASLVSLIAKEECNSFGLYTFQYLGATSPRQSYALALYPTAVYFNHGCTPNVIHVERDVEEGKALHFFALKDLFKGEEALISYIGLEGGKGSDTQKRRDFLKAHFCFDCDCTRCEREINLANVSSNDPFLLSVLCLKDGCRGRFIPEAKSQTDTKSMEKVGRTDSGNVISDGMVTKWICEACGRFKD